MPLSAGDKLGPYEILAPIGKGGMGEVYKARDTKLDRDVAVKVLPAALARDPERLARFEREAKVLASLNHPNIAQIYGIEESSTGRALIMELVPGQTLKGPLPLETALNYAKQIADALEAAHEKSITHRDLKLANIMVTPAGVIKVLDFGLAAVSPASTPDDGNPTDSPTLTMQATQAGMIIGTAAYMSPEQAAGQAVDKRADIWAFGVVLWEMLSGQRLFSGDTVAHTLAAVLQAPIDFDKLTAPAPIKNLLRRCLDRDVKNRLRDIGEARITIQKYLANPTSLPDVTQSALSRSRFGWSVAGLLLATTLSVSFAYFREKSHSVAISMRFQIPSPANAPFGTQMSLSPDGRLLAFSSASDNAIWIRPLDALEARPLAGTQSSNNQPFFWSPDSRFIAYGGGGKLMKIDVSGGPPQALCDAPQGVIGGTWSREGVILFGQNTGGLMRVPAAGGVASPVTELSQQGGAHTMPQFLPDGRHFVYRRAFTSVEDTGIYAGSLESKTPDMRLLASPVGAVYAPSPDSAAGQLLFMRGQTLMVQPFDPGRSELAGEPAPIADGIGSILAHGYFSASTNGVLAYRKGGSNANYRLTWFDRTGKEIGFAGEPGNYAGLALSPDGTRVAVSAIDEGNQDIWVIDLARNTNTRFTSDPNVETAPVWSPDGTSIVFLLDTRSAGGGVRRKLFSGLGAEEQLIPNGVLTYMAFWDWSRDGRYLLYGRREQNGKVSLWFLPMDVATKDRKPAPFLATEFNNSQAQFSPDSHWVAYASDESGKTEIYVQPFPASSGEAGKTKVSEGGGTYPRWRRDGKELFYFAGDRHMMAVEVATTPSFKAGIPKVLFPTNVRGAGGGGPFRWDVSADGKRFLLDTAKSETAEEPITVVTNWQAGLKR